MKPRGNSPGQAHARERIALYLAAVENHHVGRIARLPIGTHEQPTVVFTRRAGTRHEYGFAVLISFRHPVALLRAAFQVITHDATHFRISRLLDRV